MHPPAHLFRERNSVKPHEEKSSARFGKHGPRSEARSCEDRRTPVLLTNRALPEKTHQNSASSWDWPGFLVTKDFVQKRKIVQAGKVWSFPAEESELICLLCCAKERIAQRVVRDFETRKGIIQNFRRERLARLIVNFIIQNVLRLFLVLIDPAG